MLMVREAEVGVQSLALMTHVETPKLGKHN